MEKFKGFVMPALVVLLVVASFVIGSLWTKVKTLEGGGAKVAGTDSAQQGASPTPIAVDVSKIDTEGEPFIGKVDAPVTIAYWFDYQCPFCKQFEVNTLPSIIKDYVDSGKVRVVFKDFQFLGADSQTAGLAAHAVWETAPDKFIDWEEAMFNKQDAENGGWGSKDDIIAMTKTISGIDANKVSGLMDSKADEYQKEQDGDKSEGDSLGINGTPGSIVYNKSTGKYQVLSGAVPYEQFKSAIDSLL